MENNQSKNPLDKVSILYEDNHLIAFNKPAGVLVQGDKTGDEPLVEWGKEYIKQKYNKEGNVFLGVIHRIDRPVSGVVVMARTSKALSRMNDLFSKRKVHKEYKALVEGSTHSKGELIHWLRKNPELNITKAFPRETRDALRSELEYFVAKKLNEKTLLTVVPHTGRPHQIRVQLAAMGKPIIGDVKYGGKEHQYSRAIMLHASMLRFVHPVKKEEIAISAPIPEYFPKK
jgi:23S rRNA pseudouridine1911/1915/1917 synthase